MFIIDYRSYGIWLELITDRQIGTNFSCVAQIFKSYFSTKKPYTNETPLWI